MTNSLAEQVPAAAVRAELAKISASNVFTRSGQLNRLLDRIVQQALAGQQDAIKEQILGIEVFGRDTSYDPKADSIVRTEARRLRNKLREYYEIEGAGDPVVIEVPKGTYVPVFRLRQPVPKAKRHSLALAWPLAAVAMGLAATGAGIFALFAFRDRGGFPRVYLCR